jgi:hypothetical protein
MAMMLPTTTTEPVTAPATIALLEILVSTELGDPDWLLLPDKITKVLELNANVYAERIILIFIFMVSNQFL